LLNYVLAVYRGLADMKISTRYIAMCAKPNMIKELNDMVKVLKLSGEEIKVIKLRELLKIRFGLTDEEIDERIRKKQDKERDMIKLKIRDSEPEENSVPKEKVVVLYLEMDGNDVLVCSDGFYKNMHEIRIHSDGKVDVIDNGNLECRECDGNCY
jgi:hypothetical protein